MWNVVIGVITALAEKIAAYWTIFRLGQMMQQGKADEKSIKELQHALDIKTRAQIYRQHGMRGVADRLRQRRGIAKQQSALPDDSRTQPSGNPKN